MSTSLDDLVDDLRPYAIDFVQQVGAAGLNPRVTSTLRSHDDQSRLYRRYLAGQSGGLPAAPPGASAHEYGWAFDMIVSPYDAIGEVGRFWQSEYGGEWGAKRDPVHFQLPGATQAAKDMLKQAIVDQADPQTPWLYRPGAIPKWMEDGFNMVPGVTLVSDLLSYLGIN